MEIYDISKPNEEELIVDDEINESFESYETQSKLLNTIKEVLELTEYTTEEVLSYHENGTKRESRTTNYLTDVAITNVALYYFLELIHNPKAIIEDLAIVNPEADFEDVVDLVLTIYRPTVLINSFKRAVEGSFSEEISIASIKKELAIEEVKLKEFRKEELIRSINSYELAIKDKKKELAELESNVNAVEKPVVNEEAVESLPSIFG